MTGREASRRDLPFSRLGGGGVHLAYLEDRLGDLLGDRPATLEGFIARLGERPDRSTLVPLADIGNALEAYAARHDAPEAVLANARKVGAGDALVVVTGQQPGLLGGPLYTLHKAATAVRLAREASAASGRSIVPLFWNHSDDHDWDEVNAVHCINPNQDVQRYRLDLPHVGQAVRHMMVGEQLDEVVAAIADTMPDTEFRDDVLAMLRAASPATEQLGDGLARLLFAVFGSAGLLVIEPRDLPASAFDVLPEWGARAERLRTVVREAAAEVRARGLPCTIDPETTLMFQIDENGRRAALSGGDADVDASMLSPGALLRPVWQDACFPTVGFVVGPGELAYLTVVQAVYGELDIPMPALIPRASLTLVEPSVAKLLDRFGCDLPDLADGPDKLRRAVDDGTDEDVEGVLDVLIEHLEDQLRFVSSTVKKTDAGMVGAVDRVRSKCRDDLSKLRNRLHNARQNRLGTGARQVRRLCSTLRPRGALQERVLSAVPWLFLHGFGLGETLVSGADPFAGEHGVLEL